MSKKIRICKMFILSVTAFIFLAMAFLPGLANAAVTKVICVPWMGDTDKYHTTWDGNSTLLKCVIKTDDTSTIWYKWNYGDGNESPVSSLSGSTKYNVESSYTYTGAVGAPFTARLIAADNNALANPISDNYLVSIEDYGLDARVNVAIDNGLWFLYKTQIKGAYSAGTYGTDPVNYGYWNNGGVYYYYTSYYQGPTSSAVQAFEINNHLQGGDPDEDPYVETVERGFNYIFANTYVQGIGAQTGGHPEDYDNNGTGDGNGIAISGTRSRPIYELGQIMDAIIASDTPFETANTGPANVIGKTYKDILQDMVDMYAWGQSEYWRWISMLGTYGYVGGWRYSWNNWPDNSASQWAAIGIIPSEDLWGLKTPDWVKTFNNNWLWYSYDGTGFGYTGPDHGTYARVASGMVQLAFCDLDKSDSRWVTSENYIASTWNVFLGTEEYYDFYAFAKAMRLTLPAPVETLSSGLDWYRGDAITKGLAQKLVEMQQSSGSWPYRDWPYVGTSLRTAWSIIILRPTLFQAAPIACFDADPNPNYPDMPTYFDPSCSDHSEGGKDINNIVLFEWDWESDGVYNEDTATPDIAAHSFPCTTLPTSPCSYPVTLKVTDDNNISATYSLKVNITNPPHPPVADPNGPYTVSLCDDILSLDGSGSYDPNEGEHEAGCSACPDDTITSWDWDIDGAPYTYTNESGEVVVLDNSGITSYFGVGDHTVALRVTDNTALSYPGSGEPNYTDEGFTTIKVYDCSCIGPVSARAKDSKVDLTWEPVAGAASYDIYRSTKDSTSGFTLIKADHVTTYAVYADFGLTNGTTYWYRVVPKDPSGAEMCGSEAASATPIARRSR